MQGDRKAREYVLSFNQPCPAELFLSRSRHESSQCFHTTRCPTQHTDSTKSGLNADELNADELNAKEPGDPQGTPI